MASLSLRKKRVHLELPAEVLGTESGHKLLTLGYKRLAKDIEGDLGVKLDTSMYNKGTGKPYRQPNVMRDTGTCKRQIDADDLYEIDDEESYREACGEPGDQWMPEDMSKNMPLATRMQAYLKEAEEQQEAIKHQPVLKDDDIDRLSLNIPPCIKALAGLTQYISGNTFNDIAMQLTAYAVTTGRTEDEFLGGCNNFILSYPSTSLNTPAKRIENCRARFRTMAANGNQHSCGGILALKIPGFDCKTCESKQAGPDLGVEVVQPEDVAMQSFSLQIPADVANAGGLITLGMEALSAPGMPDIPQYNLAVVLTTLARAISGKVTACGVHPNVYNIKVGRSSTGKSSSDKAVVRALKEAGIQSFYGATDFSSGPALMRALSDMPVQMMVIDECTHMFRRTGKADPVADAKRDALMEIYSASGNTLNKIYSEKKNNIEIDCPCLSMTGNATGEVFNAIQQEDFNTGTMQRFDLWAYDGPALEMKVLKKVVNEDLQAFAKGIKSILEATPADAPLAGMTAGDSSYELRLTPEAEEALQAWSNDVIRRCNEAETDGDSAMISRQYDLAIKYAMIHMAGTRPVEAIFLPLDVQDIEYGIKVAKMLVEWKINILRGKVTTGDFHRNCEIFKAAIVAVLKTEKRPTLKAMVNRRPQMKNWKKKDTDEVIFILQKRGEIVIDDRKKPTAYQLVK